VKKKNIFMELREEARKHGFEKEADILYLKRDLDGFKKLLNKNGHFLDHDSLSHERNRLK